MGFCPMHDFCWNLPSLCFICAIKHSIVCGALMPRTGSIWLGYTNWKASGINPKYLALNRTIGNRQIHRPSADGSVYIQPMDRHRPMGEKFTIVWTLTNVDHKWHFQQSNHMPCMKIWTCILHHRKWLLESKMIRVQTTHLLIAGSG